MPEKINAIHITDIGRDTDDEYALLTSLGYAKYDPNYNVTAVVANYSAAERRARLARSMLDALGFSEVTVGTGCDPNPNDFQPYEFESEYAQPAASQPDGQEVLGQAFDNASDSTVSWLLHSSLRDAADFLERNQALCLEKLRHVVIQAGVLAMDSELALDYKGRLQPDDSFNLACDPAAAAYMYDALQALGIPMLLVSRYAAYQAWTTNRVQAAFSVSPVGRTIVRRQKKSFDAYWRQVHAPMGSAERGDLPARVNREHFVDKYFTHTRRSGEADDEWTAFNERIVASLKPTDSVAGLIPRNHCFDAVAVYLSLPHRLRYFSDPYIHTHQNTSHAIVGISKSQPGLKDEEALLFDMESLEAHALTDRPFRDRKFVSYFDRFVINRDLESKESIKPQ